MIAIIQRVSTASVSIEGSVHSSIDRGLLILLGVGQHDNQEDVDWLVSKIARMRIFSDEAGKMNLSLQETNGGALVVSQFTLQASTKKGNRPSFIEAAPPDIAIPLYEQFVLKLGAHIERVETGIFGADMQVSLLNDGPVTIIIDSKNKK